MTDVARIALRRTAASVVLALTTTLAGAAESRAQADSAVRSITGAMLARVADSAGTPIAGAEIVLPTLEVSFDVPSGGALLIDHVRPGMYVVAVRRIGYAPQTRLVRVGTDTSIVSFVLTEATQLDTVNVRTSAYSSWQIDFERRSKLGLGRFFTRAGIDSSGATRVTGVLRNVLGVRVTPGRGLQPDMVRSIRSVGRPCPSGMLVFLDGALMNGYTAAGAMRVTLQQPASVAGRPQGNVDGAAPDNTAAGGSGGTTAGGTSGSGSGGTTAGSPGTKGSRPLPPTAAAVTRQTNDRPGVSFTGGTGGGAPVFDMNQLPLSMVTGIEVYTDLASVPPEYRLAGAECGVILLWTTR